MFNKYNIHAITSYLQQMRFFKSNQKLTLKKNNKEYPDEYPIK